MLMVVEKPEREEWEDDIKSFVPSFADVIVTQIAPQTLKASMVIDKDKELAIHVLDEDETVHMAVKVNDFLHFTPQDVMDGPWEQYIGLLEVAQLFADFSEALLNKVDEVRDAMDEIGMPMSSQEAREQWELDRANQVPKGSA